MTLETGEEVATTRHHTAGSSRTTSSSINPHLLVTSSLPSNNPVTKATREAGFRALPPGRVSGTCLGAAGPGTGAGDRGLTQGITMTTVLTGSGAGLPGVGEGAGPRPGAAARELPGRPAGMGEPPEDKLVCDWLNFVVHICIL